ncbi:MAG: hypothetical protein AAF367_14480 [Pseudomonadota bacterium]
MADNEKAKSAKERLAAAKKAAVDAETVSETAGSKAKTAANTPPKPTAADGDARDHAIEGALNAAEGKEQRKGSGTDKAKIAKASSDKPAITGASDKSKTTAKTTDKPADPKATDKKTTDTSPPAEDKKPAATPEPDKPASRPLSATLLTWLVIFILGAAAALVFGPRIAPSLPGPIAAFLAPGAEDAAAEIARLEAQSAAEIAALTERLASIETSLADQDALTDTIADVEGRLSAEIEQLANAPGEDLSAIEASINAASGRVTAVEATLEGLRTELDALAGVSGENAAPSAETLARVAAFGAAVEGLRGEVAALSDRTSEIDSLAAQEQVTSLIARVDALEGGEAATTSARDEADQIRRAANLDAALTRISQALASGDPFAEPLSTAVSLSGEPAPEPLSSVAADGAPTIDELARGFGPAAQDAYAAAVEADAGDGFGSRLMARLEGRVGGRPAAETEGADAGAVLSRMEARLGEGQLNAVLTEAAQLPEVAAAAMSGWLARVETADTARAGLTQWRSALGAN